MRRRHYYPYAPGAYQGDFARDFMGGMRVGQALGDSLTEMDVNARTRAMAEQVGKANGDLNAIDPKLYSDPRGLKALGMFTESYINSREGMMKARQAHMAEAEQGFNMLNSGIQALEQMDPNSEQFAMGLQDLTKRLHLPYFAKFNPETGRFDEYYNERGGEQATGRSYSGPEAAQFLAGLARNSGEYNRLYQQYATATMLRNTEYLQDPRTWMYGEDGSVFVPRKMATKDGFKSGFLVSGKNIPPNFYSTEDLIASGRLPREFNQMIKMQGLQNRRAGIGLRQAAMAAESAAPREISPKDAGLIKDLSTMEDSAGGKRVEPYKHNALKILLARDGLDPTAADLFWEESLRDTIDALKKVNPDVSPEEAERLARMSVNKRIRAGLQAAAGAEKPGGGAVAEDDEARRVKTDMRNVVGVADKPGRPETGAPAPPRNVLSDVNRSGWEDWFSDLRSSFSRQAGGFLGPGGAGSGLEMAKRRFSAPEIAWPEAPEGYMAENIPGRMPPFRASSLFR